MSTKEGMITSKIQYQNKFRNTKKKKPLILSRKKNIIRETLRETEVIEKVLVLQVHDIRTTLYGRWKNVIVTEVECFHYLVVHCG